MLTEKTKQDLISILKNGGHVRAGIECYKQGEELERKFISTDLESISPERLKHLLDAKILKVSLIHELPWQPGGIGHASFKPNEDNNLVKTFIEDYNS